MIWLGENWLRVILALTGVITSSGVLKFLQIHYSNKTANRQIDLQGDEALNKHYATELSSLRAQLVVSGEAGAKRAQAAEERYIAGMAAAEARHAVAQEAAERRFSVAMDAAAEREQACEDRVRELRDEVRGLSEEIVGLRRNVGQQGRSAIVLASQVPNLSISEAADRAADALETIDHRQRDLPHHEMESDQ